MLLREAVAFVRSVELNSLSAAARSLGVSTSAISTRIQQLETHYGVQLLARNTRGLQPTEAGDILYPHATRILQAMEEARTSVAEFDGAPQGVLRLRAPIGFGRQFLVPLVSEFHVDHPKVDIRLRLSDHSNDLFDDDCDVAIQLGSLPDSNLMARTLARCPQVLCASPVYLARFGWPAVPADLTSHNCLVMRISGVEEKSWALSTIAGPQIIRVKGQFAADCSDVLLELALQGDGIVRRPLWEVTGHLTSGQLAEVLPDNRPPPLSLNVLHRDKRLVPLKIKTFNDFLVQRLRPRLETQLKQAGF